MPARKGEQAMPKIRQIEIYDFKELSEKAKEKARDWYREGALDYEWWDHIYEDAKNIGLKITSFNLERGSDIEGKFTKADFEVANAILKDHGDATKTYKDAKNFLKDLKAKEATYYKADKDNEDFEGSEEAENLSEKFLKTLLQDYFQILQNEYEYLMSDEAVDETIESNGYEFHKDGSRA
jgi:hypothetical protein